MPGPAAPLPPPPPPAYGLGIRAYGLALRTAALWRADARAWVRGRVGGTEALARRLEGLPHPRVWMHCASLGEFEQGRPLLEALLADPAFARDGRKPHAVVTFFSPSGHDVVAPRHPEWTVAYLPPDTAPEARRFAAALDADLGLVIKYEFWLHHLHAMAAHGTPLALVGARFRPDQVFFGPAWPWRRWFRDGLRRFRHLFVQDEASRALLAGIGLGHAVHAGDPRFDRVLDVVASARLPEGLRAFAGGGPVLVAGSTWPEDERLLAGLAAERLLPAGWRLIVAPHKVDAAHVDALMARLPEGAVRWSRLGGAVPADARILVVDAIGLLSALYGLARAAYVGGGFGAGIHNTLEPAAHGIPVAFGPRWRKFAEAGELLARGAATEVRDADGLAAWFAGLPANAEGMGAAAGVYVREGAGGTERMRAILAADQAP